MTKTRPMSEANPELFAQWRDETEADTHLLGSSYSALWEGACGHQWRATISSRMAGKGCPLCSGNRTVAGVNDLATLRPDLVVEWSKKNDKTPAEVTTGSAYIAIWECAAHRHEYTMMVAQHAREGRGCPICSGRRILTGFNDFATANPDMAAEFVRDAEGKGRTPHTVGANSHAKFIWRCAEGHEWPSEPAQRSAGMKCRVCRGRKSARPARPTRSVVRALPPKNRPLTIAEHSPDLVAEFVCDSENLGRTPHNTARGSNANLRWRCLACNFEYVSPPRHRTAGRGCPACAGTVIVPGNNDLATKFPDIAAELDDGNYTADQLLPNSNIMVQWKCKNGHTWKTRVFNRTRGDSGCNTCVRKEFSSAFERDILALVTAALPGEDITPTARSVVKNRELDMCIPGRGIAIEANGVYWHTEKFGKTERYHANKAEACAEQGINLITIWEDDWKTQRPAAEAYLLAQFQDRAPGTLHIDPIALDEANTFIAAHSLDAPIEQNTSKSYPFIAVSAREGGKLAAVVIYHKTPERALRIDRYTAEGASPRYLESLIDHLEETVTGYDHILYDDNAERSQRAVFEKNGFAVRNKLNPRYTLVKGSTRYAPDAAEVNDGGAYEKAWDCGGTVLRRERQRPVVMSVTVSAPELLAEWRSADISPDETLIGSGKLVTWECANGHTWESKVFERTKRGRGCPACKHKVTPSADEPRSVPAPAPMAPESLKKSDVAFEQEVADYISSIVPTQTVIQPARGIVKGHELDIYLPDLGIAIEANGVYWHSEAAGKKPGYHKEKADACAAAGIRLIQVWEDDWKVRRGVVEKMLAHKLGVSQLPLVPARKTTPTSISQSEAQSFLAQNHIQGYASGSHYLALQATGETVAVMVLKKTGQPGILRLERYATSARVPGGQSKLIRHAERNISGWQTLVTFADREVSDGGLYEATGWVRDGELAPDYRYLYGGERRHKFGFRLKRFRTDPKLQYVEGYSERELALLNRIPRVWDSGKIRYVYHRAA